DLQREGDGRGQHHDKDDGQAHADRGVQLFGNAQKRADAQKLHENVVVDQDQVEEDGRKNSCLAHAWSPPSPFSALAASSSSSITSPQVLRSMGRLSLRSM